MRNIGINGGGGAGTSYVVNEGNMLGAGRRPDPGRPLLPCALGHDLRRIAIRAIRNGAADD